MGPDDGAAIARLTGRAPETIAPFTSRPPLAPTELKYFVKGHTANPQKP